MQRLDARFHVSSSKEAASFFFFGILELTRCVIQVQQVAGQGCPEGILRVLLVQSLLHNIHKKEHL